LRSHLDYEAEENGDIKRVYVFSAIALFILLIACINYMNLSTARSTIRAREIGVRKAVGAVRKELILQFLSESIMLACTAAAIAIVLTYISLPLLNNVSGLQLSMKLLLQPVIIISILVVPFAIGILSGLYPAFFMSSFQTVKVLKGAAKIGNSNVSLRKVLVTAQFGISIILIICTVIVYQQLRFMRNTKPGFDKEHIITFNYDNSLSPQYDAFRNELMSNAAVEDVARSSRIPTGRLLDALNANTISGDSMVPVNVDLKFVAADYDFIPTYKVPIAAGRNFSREYATDTASFILNEAAISVLGWKTAANAVGKEFSYGGVRGHVIGVMKDFHFESMHQRILPLVFILPKPTQANFFGALSVKIAGNNIPASIAAIEKIWKKYLPETPFEYTFLEENFGRLYLSEQRQASIFTIFSCIAIFIACLGLFGLSAFAISQRVKEIGIRKVLGASVYSIVGLLSKDFLILVGIAALISFPIAWYAMHEWLLDFSYRINIEWWVFIVAAVLAAVIALATISFLAIKSAVANPVKSLRTE
jgi:putative ABC transport system permease protein